MIIWAWEIKQIKENYNLQILSDTIHLHWKKDESLLMEENEGDEATY